MFVVRSAGAAAFGLGLGAFAAVAHAAPPAIVPIPYNADIVQEVGGTTTNGLSLDGATFVTQSYAAANDATDPHGLPDDGLFTASSASLQLGPYNGNNALRLAPQESTSQISFPAAPYEFLDVYIVAGEGFTQILTPPIGIVTQPNAVAVPFQVRNFRAGGGSNIQDMNVPNFATDLVSVDVLTDGLDLTGASGAGFTDLDDAAIFRLRFGLGGTNLAPTNGLTFFNAGTATTANVGNPQAGPIYILGATLDTAAVPEPTTLLPLAVLCASAALGRRSRREHL